MGEHRAIRCAWISQGIKIFRPPANHDGSSDDRITTVISIDARIDLRKYGLTDVKSAIVRSLQSEFRQEFIKRTKTLAPESSALINTNGPLIEQ